jgi:hypothetical protein
MWISEQALELPPARGATTMYHVLVPLDWTRKLPDEHVGEARKA